MSQKENVCRKMEWKEDVVFTFVKKIQLHPCLWNPSDKNKKNRNKVHDAFKSIAKEMAIDNIEELKKKKENIFQTYRNYRRKVFCSQKSGAGFDDIYKPTWPPYSLLDDFLHGIYTPKGKFDTLDNLDTNEEEKNSEDAADSDNGTSRTDLNENEEVEKFSDSNEKRVVPTRQPLKQTAVKRPRKEQDRADVAFKELIAIKDQIAKRSATCVGRDECTVYSELLAIKLRKLDERTQRLAMHRIDTIMFDLSFDSSVLPTPMSHFSNASNLISPSSSCSQYSPEPAQTSTFYEQLHSNYTPLHPRSAVSNEAPQLRFSQLQSSSKAILQSQNYQSVNATTEHSQCSVGSEDIATQWTE